MTYAIYCGLFILSLAAMVGSRLNGKLLAGLIGLSQTALICCVFWKSGWKQGAASILFVMFLTFVTEGVACALEHKLVHDPAWAISKMKLVEKYAPSTLSLLLPIAATIWISTTPASNYEIAGYGVANFGYLLFAAAFFTGTFTLFRLTKRWQLYVAGAILVAIGTAIMNLKNIEAMLGV